MSLLAGYHDHQLLPPVVEALKAFQRQRETYDRALLNVEAQYLKSLSGLDAEALDQANAVRALYGLAPATPL